MARRQRAAWGSNEDAGNGRRRIRYWADLGDGRGYRRVSETVTGSRRDADLLLARRRVEHDSDAPVPTLRQAYEAWWLPEFEDAIERGEVKRNTLCTYTSRWRAHLEPAFGSRPVTDIRPLDVQAWLLGMTSNNAKQSIRLLSQILDVCVRYEVLGANVAASRYRMPRDSARQPAGVLTMAERDRVLEELRGTCAYLPAVLAGVGSCRVGESLAASVAAGDVRAVESHGMTLAVVEIRRQQHHDGSIEESLKNRRSERPVVIPEPWSADVLAAPGPWLCDRGGRHARAALGGQEGVGGGAGAPGHGAHPLQEPAQLVAHHLALGAGDAGGLRGAHDGPRREERRRDPLRPPRRRAVRGRGGGRLRALPCKG